MSGAPMTIRDSRMANRFVVIFGRKPSNSTIQQRMADWRDGKDAAGVIAVEAGVTPARRLGGDAGRRFAPAFLADLPDTASKLDRLKSDIARDLDVFAKHPRRLLDRYFVFLAARLDANAAEIERATRPLGGLFRLEDWAFAALQPLPNAVVFAGDLEDPPREMLIHDFAFWAGDQVLTVRLRGSATPPPHEAEACDRLASQGVHIATIPVEALVAGAEIFTESLFPPAFRSFWRGVAYPSSPFRPQGLTPPISLDASD